MIIAIDGPSGAGKSTVAKAVAKTLGFSCLDTGAMFRSLAWYAHEYQFDIDNPQLMGDLASSKEIAFGIMPGDPSPKEVYIDGIEVTNKIRSSTIDAIASKISAYPQVREALLLQQQRIGASGNYVVEGRDIGTVVFPQAELKIYLTATAEERAHRRVRQNVDRGLGSICYEEVLQAIKQRDHADASRDVAPLKPAADALQIDSTHDYIEDIIARICTEAANRKLVESASLCDEAFCKQD